MSYFGQTHSLTDGRWHVVVTFYRFEKGKSLKDREIFSIDEIEELHEIIERGPDFHSIISINITHNQHNGF
jgi:hypothetical protein